MFLRCSLSRSTAAWNCVASSEYGSVILSSGLGGHQVDGCIGDVDLVVVGRDLAGVLAAALPDDAPAIRVRLDDVGPPHEQVGATTVRDAVGDPIDRVVLLALEAVEHLRKVGDELGVHCRNVTAGDQAQRGVARERSAVVLAGLHQGDRVGRPTVDLRIDLAARLLLERRDPVGTEALLTARTADHVVRPHGKVETALTRADLGRQARSGAGGLAGDRARRTSAPLTRRSMGRSSPLLRCYMQMRSGPASPARPRSSVRACLSSSSCRSDGSVNPPHLRWGARAVASRSGGQPRLAARAPRSRWSSGSARSRPAGLRPPARRCSAYRGRDRRRWRWSRAPTTRSARAWHPARPAGSSRVGS